ncbi:MAG: hypothetical protein ABIS36_11070 [Chryseolinea sp.]
MNAKLFSHGTLQQEKVQISTFKRKLKSTQDAIVGCRLSMLEIKNANAIVTSGKNQHPIVKFTGDKSGDVAGTVFEITETELLMAMNTR